MAGGVLRCTARVTEHGVTLKTDAHVGVRCDKRAVSGIHGQPLCEEHHLALAAHLRVLQRIRAIPHQRLEQLGGESP